MRKITINIQSISDVITNSSNEIFTTFDNKEMINTIKQLVDSLLAIGISDYKFDDLFNIEIHWDDSENYKDRGFETEEEYVKYLDENSGWTDNDYEYGVSCSYAISVKPEASDILGTEEIANLLNKIQNLFISNEYYG